MRTNKTLNNCPMNAAAWGWEYEEKGKKHDGISVGLYKKPTRKTLAEDAKSIVELFSVDGKLVCQVNMKRLNENGIKLVLNKRK